MPASASQIGLELEPPKTPTPESPDLAYSNPIDQKTNTKKPKKSKAQSAFLGPSDPQKLPDWIDSKTWHDYETHRKALRKPLVNGSITHVLRDLEKLSAQGHDPNAVLSQSIVRGWVGVFPLAGEHPCQTFVPGNRTAKPGGIDLGPSGRSTRDAAERWLNNSNSIENAQENPEP